MSDPQTERIKMKIGGAEFEAEGTPDSVRERFEKFVELVAKQMAMSPENPSPVPIRAPRTIVEASPPILQSGPATLSGDDQAPITDDVLTRVFRRGDDGVSLLALPRGDKPDADALISLLYAFARLLNKPHVTGVALMTAARQSGVNIRRVDTVLKSRDDLVMAAGARRGRRYSLNNRGNIYAEGLVRKMIE